jgi:hypothetical protein
MGRSISKKASKLEYWHTWVHDDYKGIYFIRDYHTCRIEIIRYCKGEVDPVTNHTFEKVTYVPTLCGIRLNRSWDNTNDDHPIYFNSLESAKHHACKKWDLNKAMYPILFSDMRKGGSMVRNMVKANEELQKSGKYNPYGE